MKDDMLRKPRLSECQVSVANSNQRPQGMRSLSTVCQDVIFGCEQTRMAASKGVTIGGSQTLAGIHMDKFRHLHFHHF